MTAVRQEPDERPRRWFRRINWLVVFGLLEVAAGVVAFLVGGEQFAAWSLIFLGLLALGGAMEQARIDRMAARYQPDRDEDTHRP